MMTRENRFDQLLNVVLRVIDEDLRRRLQPVGDFADITPDRQVRTRTTGDARSVVNKDYVSFLLRL